MMRFDFLETTKRLRLIPMLLAITGASALASGDTQALTGTTSYRCVFSGIAGNRVGYLVASSQDISEGGVSLELSDSLGFGQIDQSFSGASLGAYPVSGGQQISALLTSHNPGNLSCPGMTERPKGLVFRTYPLGIPSFHLEKDTDQGAITLDCTRQ